MFLLISAQKMPRKRVKNGFAHNAHAKRVIKCSLCDQRMANSSLKTHLRGHNQIINEPFARFRIIVRADIEIVPTSVKQLKPIEGRMLANDRYLEPRGYFAMTFAFPLLCGGTYCESIISIII